MSSPNVAVHPLRPATDHRLGGPLPLQLANQTQSPPSVIAYNRGHLSSSLDAEIGSYAVLAVVSNCCPPLKGRLITRYSPVRH